MRATVTQFNTVTGCVLGSVLGAPGLAAPQRAQRLEKWIRIAQVRVGGEGTGMEVGGRIKVGREGGGGQKAEGQGPGNVETVGAGRCLNKCLGRGYARLGPGQQRDVGQVFG